MIYKKLPLTLIEMLIVLAILSLVGSFVVFGIQKAQAKQLFLNESELVLKAVKLSQDLMLTLNADVSLKFKEGGSKILYWIEVGGAEKDPFIGNLSKPRTLTSIHVVEFEETGSTSQDEQELTLKFFSGGSLVPKGILRLSTVKSAHEEKGYTRYVPFPGYPVFFSLVNSSEEAKQINEQEQEGHDLLTRITMEEFNSLTPMPSQGSRNESPDKKK